MSYRARVVTVSVSLLLAAFALSALFSLMTLDRTYRDELLERYYVPLAHLRANLERAAEQGLDLERARGIGRDVARIGEKLEMRIAPLDGHGPGVLTPALVVVTPEGKEIFGHGGRIYTPDDAYQRALALPNGKGESASSTRYVEGTSAYYIPMRILDAQGRWAASLVTRIDKLAIERELAAPRAWALNGTVLALALVMLNYMLALAMVFESAAGDDRKLLGRILWVSIVSGVIAQLASAHVGTDAYKDRFVGATTQKGQVIAELAHGDVYRTLSRGMKIEFLDFRQYPWSAVLDAANEIGSITLELEDGAPVVHVTADGVTHLANERLQPLQPIDLQSLPGDEAWRLPLERRGAQVGNVAVYLSLDEVQARVIDLGLDALSATLVSLLIFVELLLVAHWALNRRRGGGGARTLHARPGAGAGNVIRPAAFTFLLGIDLSMSFVPLHMERLYEPMFGLSKDFVMGLPISVEFLFVGLSMLGAGLWIDRVGWRRPFIFGTALAAVGALYSWAATEAIGFIVARGVLGIGYGLTLMACQAYVVRTTTSKDRATGLAQLFAGIYGGSISGGVAGAIFAERVGYGPVFLAGGIIVLGVLLYALIALPRNADAAWVEESEQQSAILSGTGAGRLRRFLTNRTMIGLMLFSSLPASIAAVGFLNYYSPIYLNRIGASQSTIGQVLMLYGACLVFFGPWVSRRMDTVESKRLAVMAGCLLGATAFLSFNLFEGITAAAVAVVMLGLSHSLVLSSQSAYALALRVSKELGEGKAISVFRSSGRFGQMLGPLAFGGVALAGDMHSGITYIGYGYLVAAVLFWLCTRRDRAMLAEA